MWRILFVCNAWARVSYAGHFLTACSLGALTLNHAALPVPARADIPLSNRIASFLTVERVLWAVLIVIAIWTRFWDLGYRAQHHDESLHSYYSGLFATGDRLYVHHPLMHGPFLFHANALVYRLFGDNDTTSRLIPAVFGVAIVWMPWLLRSKSLLGRWGALAAGYMLLISPAMLYYTRYIRHDPYMVAGCLLLAIAVFRYLEQPQRRWIIIAFATVAFLLANHELVLATFLIMVTILWGSLLLTHLRPLIPVHVVAFVFLGIAAWLWLDHPWPPIPWSRPASSALDSGEAFVFLKILGPVVLAVIAILAVIALVRNQVLALAASAGLAFAGAAWLWIASDRIPPIRPWNDDLNVDLNSFLTTSEFYWAALQHPFVQAVLITVAMFLIACFVTIRWMLNGKSPDEDGPGYLLGDAKPNSVAYGVLHALRDPTGLLIGIFVCVAFWVVLYTTWFTNPGGIGSGTYETNGTILYWLGQHDVQRGAQPWFYFILLGLQYEWLTVTLAAAGSLLLTWRLLRWLAGGEHGPNLLWKLFIVGWFAGTLLVLSWAGEKMPWLIMHIVLPASLVGGWVMNTVIEGALAWMKRQESEDRKLLRYGTFALFGGLVLLAMSWFFITARLTWVEWSPSDVGGWVRTLPASTLNDWWKLTVPALAAMFLIATAIWVLGTRRTIYTTLAATVALMSLFQVHVGFRAAYIDGDLAVDTLIYNTISADMTQFTDDMDELSLIVHGDNSISIAYDQCRMQWPTHWYLNSHDFPNARSMSYSAMDNPDVILVAQDSRECGWPDQIPGYTPQLYALRVHEREDDHYRRFAIAPEIPMGRSAWITPGQAHDLPAVLQSIASSLRFATTPEGQQKIFRQVMYRDQSAPQTVYYMTVWVRNDLVPDYNNVRYGETLP